MLRFLGAVFFATVLSINAASAAPRSAGVNTARTPPLVPLMRAAASDPALLYTLPRWMLRGPRPVVKRTFGGASALAAGYPENLLFIFDGSDGYSPSGLMRDASGAFYGTTLYGGASGTGCGGYGCGTVFKLTPPAHGGAWTQTTLYSFTGAADGGNPYAALIEDANGVLYSTTSAGGTTGCGGYGCGTVFALTPPAPGQSTWTESVLYAFTGATDGSYPTAELTAFDGALFTPSAYGGALGEGAILEFTPPPPGSTTWSEQVAYSFGAPGDGQYPSGDLLAAGGALYTTTAFGGTHNIGTVVELTPPSSPGNVWTDSVLHSFDGFDGLYPSADLLADNAGNVYSTSGGGRGGCFGEDGACGIAFKLTPPVSPQTTWTEHVLYYFVGSIDYDPSSGLIADSHGSLYGTTAAGGPSGAGVVYKLAHSGKSTWSQTILRAFDGGADGGNPYDDLIDDSYGNLYGVAGGGIGDGVVYELTK